MVFVSAIGFSQAAGIPRWMIFFAVLGAFILYWLILNAANSNPSIRTVLYVTLGFIFGLALAVILDFDSGILSAFVCLLCMGYKYMVAKASAGSQPRSRNIFVILVNGLFYATMFTVVECMAFSQSSPLYVMIYVASFLFILYSYITYRRMGPAKRVAEPGKKTRRAIESKPTDLGGDWKHILKRISNYGKELKEQFEDALDNSGDTFSGLIDEIRKRILPDYSDNVESSESKKKELDHFRVEMNLIAAKEDLTDNELEIFERINTEFDEIYYEFCRTGKMHDLEFETRMSKMTNDMEMLKNTISIRKVREAEDKEKEDVQNRRSRAQQARRKREREERERKEREEREKEEKKGEEDEEPQNGADEEKRREEERKRQEKRRRERNRRTSGSSERGRSSSAGAGSAGGKEEKEDDSSKVAGIKTKYFKGCKTVDELSLRYKKLCLIYHPDSGNGDVDTYIELKDEYETLKKRLS